jgi:alcohol dehydrogenase class IV
MISFTNPNISICNSPRQVHIGDHASAKVGELCKTWQIPAGSVLVVADREVARLGLHHDLQTSLKTAGFDVSVFDGIVGEPDLETATSLARCSREQSYQAVVGIGGGSAMDMAKLAAALATNGGEVKGYLGVVTFAKAPLPLILIPTTAGTGAEATAVSMLSVEGRKVIVLSPQLIPLAAVLDPVLSLSLPAKVTAATGLDALSHAFEAYMSLKSNPFTDAQAMTAIGIIAQWLKPAFDDGSNLEARRAMALAAYLGGLSLNAGVVIGHSVAYTIANRTHLAHGTSCTMSLPYTILYNIPAISERLARLAAVVLNAPLATPADLAQWVDDLNGYLEMPRSLKDIGVTPDALDDMVEECLARYPRPTNPVEVTKDRLKVVYEKMYEGDVKGCAASLHVA